MGIELVSDLQATGLARHTAMRAAIAATGIRQGDVARKAGISGGQLSKVLSGHKPLTADLDAAISAAISELVA